MEKTSAEWHFSRDNNETRLYFRKQNRDFGRYFFDYSEQDPLDDDAVARLIGLASVKAGIVPVVRKAENGSALVLVTKEADSKTLEAFAEAFLDVFEEFYEENEVHITRMFGSFICLKRERGALKAVKATPVPIRYCPLMKQLLTEVGGSTAQRLLDAVGRGDACSQTEMMCELINEVVIKGGYFDTSRPLNSCEANVLFGASETMSTAFQNGLIDAAVIVSNNLGTIITTNDSNTQGAVKRMTGLFLTSPSKEIAETAREAGIIPVFPHTASIDQLEGVRLALALGYRRIAVSVAWMDNILLNEISRLERDGSVIYKFGLCSTGIDDETAEAMKAHADLIWSCASRAVRQRIAPSAIAQVGVKIPVHIMTEKGWRLVKNHLEATGMSRGEGGSYDGIICRRGPEKPVILNDGNRFQVIAARDLQECLDCPNPCV